jgi:hypothetical protein
VATRLLAVALVVVTGASRARMRAGRVPRLLIAVCSVPSAVVNAAPIVCRLLVVVGWVIAW